MAVRTALITDRIPIAESAQIIYVYDKRDCYLKNVLTFIESAIEQEEHVLLIDDACLFDTALQHLARKKTPQQLTTVHFASNACLVSYFQNEQTDESLLSSIGVGLHDYQNRYHPLRLWIRADTTESVPERIQHFSKSFLMKLQFMFVAAFDGNKISAQTENVLRKCHEYFMTDDTIVLSNLIDENLTPFKQLSVQQSEKKTRLQLQATRERLESFIGQNIDPIMILDKNDQSLFINQAFSNLLGWTERDVVGLPADKLPEIDPKRAFEVGRDRDRIKLQNQITAYESIRKTKFGRLINVSITGYPLVDENGEYNGRVMTVQDITATKQAQLLHFQAEKLSLYGEMAAGLAHEIRNPITAIKGFLQLARLEKKEDNDYLPIMAAEIRRIESILNELLMLAKPKATRFCRNNLIEIIEDAVTLLHPQASLAQVDLITTFDKRPLFIFCDKNQLKQVCVNFIKNAIEAMPKDGKVRIHVKSRPGEAIIVFSDQGKGMSKNILEHIGTPFFTTKEQGTGLGMMVSNEIVKSHQGTVAISSKVTRGTTVEIHLPQMAGIVTQD